MTPRFAFLSLALFAACGGTRSTARTTSSTQPATRTTVLVSTQPFVDREPVRAGAETLYAEYVMSVDGKTHDRLMLAGEVTCYGGPLLEGNVPVEVYVRRGVSADQIVEDTVAIFPDDLVPRRQLLAMTPGEGPTELHEGAVPRGHALLGDDAGAEAVQVFTGRDGGIIILAHSAKEHAMTFVAHRLAADIAAAEGLSVDQLQTADDWAKLLARIGSIAADSTVMTYKGELPMIPAAECGEMFAHFPPPKRR